MNDKSLISLIMSMLGSAVFVFGGAVPLLFKEIKSHFLSIILGFTGGIMLYAAFLKFLPSSLSALTEHYGTQNGTIMMTVVFFAGLLIPLLIAILASYHHR